MEAVTLVQSTIRGSVAGKMINCTVRSSPAGLKLPAGQYLLRSANNPVYGLVMSIEPTRPGGQGPSAVKYGAPSHMEVGMNYSKMVMVDEKSLRPTGLKMAPGSKVDAPASKVDIAPRSGAGAILMSDRPIAGNCLVVISGFADLVDAVQRAGGVMLIVT